MQSPVALFVGPSMPRSGLPAGINVFPPAGLNDISRVCSSSPSVVVLIDCPLLHAPATTHRELLDLLRTGTVIIGAGSSGALRAAELRCSGMIGVGIVYSALIRGLLTDDAELAVSMRADDNTALTIPLVNIRCLLGQAVRSGCPVHDAHRAFQAAKGVYFFQRTKEALVETWKDNCVSIAPILAKLAEDIDKYNIKAADTLEAARVGIQIANDGFKSNRDKLVSEVSHLYWGDGS